MKKKKSRNVEAFFNILNIFYVKHLSILRKHLNICAKYISILRKRCTLLIDENMY